MLWTETEWEYLPWAAVFRYSSLLCLLFSFFGCLSNKCMDTSCNRMSVTSCSLPTIIPAQQNFVPRNIDGSIYVNQIIDEIAESVFIRISRSLAIEEFSVKSFAMFMWWRVLRLQIRWSCSSCRFDNIVPQLNHTCSLSTYDYLAMVATDLSYRRLLHLLQVEVESITLKLWCLNSQ